MRAGRWVGRVAAISCMIFSGRTGMVLVVGATGSLGRAVCEKLARRGEKVRALVRRTSSQERISALQSCGVEACVGDLKDPGSITAACRGVNAVISLVLPSTSICPSTTRVC